MLLKKKMGSDTLSDHGLLLTAMKKSGLKPLILAEARVKRPHGGACETPEMKHTMQELELCERGSSVLLRLFVRLASRLGDGEAGGEAESMCKARIIAIQTNPPSQHA